MMKLSELTKKLNLKVLTNADFADREADGCYIGDLLSWVMGRVKENDVWITIMSNINIVAVASLTNAACILLCEGVLPDENVINKANAEDIIILGSDETAYELAKKISGEI